MTSLLLTISIIVVAYYIQKGNPVLAGLVAVIPIKIIGVGLMSHETGGVVHLQQAIKGMLIGQFFWGFTLLIIFIWLSR